MGCFGLYGDTKFYVCMIISPLLPQDHSLRTDFAITELQYILFSKRSETDCTACSRIQISMTYVRYDSCSTVIGKKGFKGPKHEILVTEFFLHIQNLYG